MEKLVKNPSLIARNLIKQDTAITAELIKAMTALENEEFYNFGAFMA